MIALALRPSATAYMALPNLTPQLAVGRYPERVLASVLTAYAAARTGRLRAYRTPSVLDGAQTRRALLGWALEYLAPRRPPRRG